ncbi:CBM_collapsed_G0006580.mRNA.1.CDS.1 [Saccharomyces cerevisiae]|nr:CBM_collapsed_G0006580.mRNA.1.CDS.1 [Saccharomyces cerevisiae]
MSQSTASLVPEGNQGSLQEDVSFDFNGVPGQALDAVRMRLAQLTHSLRRIRDEMSKAELPQWYTLQSQLNVTLSQLVSVTSTLQHFQETLDSTVVYPLPKFPTTSHESLVTTLLRKKNIPEVDEWMKYVRETSGVTTALLKDEEIEKLLQQDREITNWARTTFRNEYGKHDFKNEESLSEEHASLVVRDSKPSKPFNVDDVLKFTFTGEKPIITGSTSTSSSN